MKKSRRKTPQVKTSVPHKDAKPIFSGMNARTVDGFDNFVSRIGLRNDNTLSAGTYTYNLITRNRLLIELSYRGSWIVGRVVDCVAKDMTRAGLDISTTKGEGDLKQIKSTISRLKIWQSLCTLIQWGRMYGGALGVIQIKGQDMSTPIDLDRIGKDQFQGIVVFDRWQLNPKLDELIDSGPDMGLPVYYDVVSDPRSLMPQAFNPGVETIHYSRVIRYTGIDLPYFQAITEMMWGESILERLWDRLIAFDNASLSAASLIDRANLRTVSIDRLREVIAAGGPAYDGLIQFFEMVRSMQTNEGMTLLDKEDVFTQTSYTFAGLSDMLLQFAQQLSGATEIPLSVLMSQTPAGLNATGDSEIRIYYDAIHAQQEAKLRNGWELILKVLWRSEFGRSMPEDLEFSFNPLWQMSDMDKATIAKTKTETILGAFEAGVTNSSTTLTELRDASGDTGIFSNISDADISEAKERDEQIAEDPPIPGESDGEAKPNETKAPDAEKPPVKGLDAAYKSPAQRIKAWLLK